MSDFSEKRVAGTLQLEPGATAVLVIDMLNDFLEEGGVMVLEDGHRLYEPISRLLLEARRAGAKVIWVCDGHPDPDHDKEFEKRIPHCIEGTWGAQVVDALKPEEDEPRVQKRRYSGFYETDLDLLLRELGIETVITSGVVTNICVRSTVHDAFFRGYSVLVPTECVAATSPREQESSLYDIDTHYGRVLPLEDVLGMLRPEGDQSTRGAAASS